MNSTIQRLRSSRLRVTSGRIFVLQAIERAQKKRIRVEEVFQELEKTGTPLSLTSVYRIMKDLNREGILGRAWHGEANDIKYSYWMRAEGDEQERHRMVCRQCQRSVPVEHPSLEDEILSMGQQHGLVPAALPLTILVTCIDCASAQATAN